MTLPTAHLPGLYHSAVENGGQAPFVKWRGRWVNAAAVGEAIIDRIAFWREFGRIGAWVCDELADRLDRVSDVLERDSLRALPAPPAFADPPLIIEQPRLPDRGSTSYCGNAWTTPGVNNLAAAVAPKVWEKSGIWSEAEIMAALEAEPLLKKAAGGLSLQEVRKAFSGMVRSRSKFWCSRCNSFFPDAMMLRTHRCLPPPPDDENGIIRK